MITRAERDASRALLLVAAAWAGPLLLLALPYLVPGGGEALGNFAVVLALGVGFVCNFMAWASAQHVRDAPGVPEAAHRRAQTARGLAVVGLALCVLFGLVLFMGGALAIR